MMLTISRPAAIAARDPEDISVSEAIYTIYRHDEGWMLTLDWNGHAIFLDGIMLADIYNDVVHMLLSVQSGQEEFMVSFLDTGFTAMWHFDVDGDAISIDARWTSVCGRDEGTAEKVRAANVLHTTKSSLVKSWTEVLKVVKEDLLRAGYDSRLEGFDYLGSL